MQDERRNFLKGLTGIVGAWTALPRKVQATPGTASNKAESADQATVRDKLWVWAHTAGAHNGGWGLPDTSRMTPAEGAFYLGVPNLLIIGLPNPKVPCSWEPTAADFDAYAISFRPLKRVVWFLGRSYLRMDPKDLELVRQLAQKFPNIVGVVMDDFFRVTLDGSEVGNLTPGELAYIQGRLKEDGRKLDLWITIYDHDLMYEIDPYLRHVDVLTHWTPYAKDLEKLQEGFERLEKATAGFRKVLGCYMYDYGGHRPMPVAMMQKQCELGLKWLKERRVEGVIFLASCICDMNLDAVEWTRNWIREVGDTKL